MSLERAVRTPGTMLRSALGLRRTGSSPFATRCDVEPSWLSLAGIYAVLAYTVARRTREIGVRVALGASRRRIVAAIFRRPLTQVGLGVAAGGLLIAAGAFALSALKSDGGARQIGAGVLSPTHAAVLVAYAAFMFVVCLLACIVPTWRALRVEPTEALRVE